MYAGFVRAKFLAGLVSVNLSSFMVDVCQKEMGNVNEIVILDLHCLKQ